MRNEMQDVIKKQLTLSLVIWDLHIGAKESERYQNERDLYGIRQINLPVCKSCLDAYEWIRRTLSENSASAAHALLVTQNAALADYIYRGAKQGMALVFYEKEGEQRARADFIVQGFWEIGVQFLDRVLKRKNHLPWNILYTKRTCVREISLQDLDELFLLYQGEGITDYTEDLYERSKEEAYTDHYIRHMYYFYGYGMWIIRDRQTGALIGRAGIEHREVCGKTVRELGYVIGKEYQRQGYAYEVCRAILEYARERLCMDEIHCFIHPKNTPSIRLAKKLGFGFCEGEFCGTKGALHFCMVFG